MTDYEIIRIMRWTTETSQIDSLLRRIGIVVDEAVRQEREACAKVCESERDEAQTVTGALRAQECAKRIRARSQQ